LIQTLFNTDPSIPSLILRLAVGSLLTVHGYPKLRAGNKGQWITKMGMPAFIVPFAGFAEFFGGLGLIFGIITPIVAVLVTLWMIATTWFAISKLKKKYQSGWELDITLVLASLAIVFLGSGIYSIDHLLGI
jgi:putative oxidoreductase